MFEPDHLSNAWWESQSNVTGGILRVGGLRVGCLGGGLGGGVGGLRVGCLGSGLGGLRVDYLGGGVGGLRVGCSGGG